MAIAGARQAAAPAAISPELASLVARPPSGDRWLHEIKFDGYRMVAHLRHGGARLVSRNGNDWTGRFPELAAALDRLPATEAWLDGEIVHMGRSGITSFSALQKDLSDGATAGLIYMVFDLPYLDGWDLTAAALDDRKALLAGLLGRAPAELGRTIRFSDHQVGQGPAFFAAACRGGLEGIISKRRDATYFEGRSFAWVKSKCVAQEEFVVVGFTDPKGTRTGFGSLLLGYYTPAGDLVYAGKVGTGFSSGFLDRFHAELRRIERSDGTVALPKGVTRRGVHWVEPIFVAEICFAEWTRDRILRQPRFLGLREDKAAKDVTLELPLSGSR
jgi:bifunctional non-homologous end joining protein LigD